MSPILVLDDGSDERVQALLATAAVLGEPVAASVVAPGAHVRAMRLAELGARRVLLLETNPSALGTGAEALVRAAAAFHPEAVLVADGVSGRDAAAGYAARTGAAVAAGSVALEREGDRIVATHSVLGGAWTTRSAAPRRVLAATVRTADAGGLAEPVLTPFVVVERFDPPTGSARVVSRSLRPDAGRPSLAGASVVVSGGRGVGSKEGFAVAERLADALGAGLGASRAAVDDGYAEPELQVGQTGVTVSPRVYVALGISGAVQHLAGMRTAGTIVAVNADPDAPIFELADFGIVGDVHTVVPQAIEAIARATA